MKAKLYFVILLLLVCVVSPSYGVTLITGADANSVTVTSTAWEYTIQPGFSGRTAPDEVASQILTAGGETQYVNQTLPYATLLPFSIDYVGGQMTSTLYGSTSSVVRPTEGFSIIEFSLLTNDVATLNSMVTLSNLSINGNGIDGVWTISISAQNAAERVNLIQFFVTDYGTLSQISGNITLYKGIEDATFAYNGAQLKIAGVVPEPSSYILIASSVLLFLLIKRFRKLAS